MADEDEPPPPLDACHDAVVPFDVSTKVLAPIANLVALFVPFPMIKSPVVVIGESALNAALEVVCPVPPFAIAIVELAVTLPLPLAYIYPVRPVTAKLTVVNVVNDSELDPGIFSHVPPLNMAQSPTDQLATPFKLVVPAVDTT